MKFIDKTYQTLLLGVIFFIAGIYLRPPTSVNNKGVDQKEMYITKAHYAKNYDIVLAGDSRTYCDLSPAEMNKILTDDKIINFGFANNGFSRLYMDRVGTVVARDGNKRTLVLGISPFSLTNNSITENGFFSAFKRGRLSKFEAMYLHKYLKHVDPYSLYYTYDFLLGRQPIHSEWEYHMDGWVAIDRAVEDTLEGVAPFISKFDSNMVSDKILNDLLNRVKEWSDQGITVIGYRPPTSDTMISLENNLSGYNEDDIKLKFEQAGGIWFDYQNYYHAYDGSHLGRSAAIQFSKECAEFIKEYRQNNSSP